MDTPFSEIEALTKKYTKISFEPTIKNFNKKFKWKIKFKSRWNGGPSISTNDFHTWKGHTFGFPCKKDIQVRGDYSGRSDYSTINLFYCNDVNILKLCLSSLSKFIESVGYPLSDKQKENIEHQNIAVVRKELFYKKYQFVIRFDPIKKPNTQEMKKWVKEVIDPSAVEFTGQSRYHQRYLLSRAKSLRSDLVWYRYTDHSPSIFVTTEDEAMLIKIAWSEHIKKIEKAVLYSDIGKSQ